MTLKFRYKIGIGQSQQSPEAPESDKSIDSTVCLVDKIIYFTLEKIFMVSANVPVNQY